MEVDRVGPPSRGRLIPDRRDRAARSALVDRIRGEFQEMRGLSITVEQAARLFGIPSQACSRILADLAANGLLHLRTDGRYVLRDWSR
jgi:hypothetical protein